MNQPFLVNDELIMAESQERAMLIYKAHYGRDVLFCYWLGEGL